MELGRVKRVEGIDRGSYGCSFALACCNQSNTVEIVFILCLKRCLADMGALRMSLPGSCPCGSKLVRDPNQTNKQTRSGENN